MMALTRLASRELHHLRNVKSGPLRCQISNFSSSSDPSKFAEPSFWDDKYRAGRAPSEWFAEVDEVLDTIEREVRHNDNLARLSELKCLHIGCGLSELGLRVAKAFDHVHVTNVDVSEAAVHQLEKVAKTKYEQNVLARSVFMQDDIFASKIEDSSVDLCIDKGTLDAVEFGGDDMTHDFLRQVHRMLKPGGMYLQISTIDPGVRDAVTLADIPWARKSWSPAYEELWAYKFVR